LHDTPTLKCCLYAQDIQNIQQTQQNIDFPNNLLHIVRIVYVLINNNNFVHIDNETQNQMQFTNHSKLSFTTIWYGNFYYV